MRHTRATQAFGSCHGIAKELKLMDREKFGGAKCEGCDHPEWVPDILLFKDYGQKFEADQRFRAEERRKLEKHNKERATVREVITKLHAEVKEMDRYERAMKAKVGARVTVSYVRGAPKG